MEEETSPRRRLLQRLAAAAAGGIAAQALAARSESADETLPPLLRVTPEPLASSGESRYPLQAGEVGVVAPEYPYGHGLRYGIKTDGTDTTAEVKNWRDSIIGIGFYSDPYGFQHVRCKAVLPAGVILITEPGAMLKLMSAGPQLWGYTIEGEGWRTTTIVYDPEKPGPLLFTSNRIYGLTIRNLHFCTPDPPRQICDWLVSQSSGRQYAFTFENLTFDGYWRGGVRISAVPGDGRGDTNSEFKFDRINIGGGGFKDGLVVDSNDDALQSSQFLNYWLSNINCAMHQGSLVRLRRGGHVSITNLDISGYKPTEESWLIDLPELADSDSKHSLIIRNARFECLSGYAKFLRCRWERGTVCIDGYDDVMPWRNATDPRFEIRASNAISDDSFGESGKGTSPASAQYWFANCRFTAVHRFLYDAKPQSAGVPATIQYQNCEFCGPNNDPASRNIHSFVRLVPDGGKSLVQRPHVRFRACRVEAVPNHVTDWDLGVQGPHASTTAPIKSLRFGTNDSGCLPSGGAISMVVPPASLVLRVTWILPAGRAPVAGKPYRFELCNGYDGRRQEILAVFEGEDFNVRAGRVDLLAHETAPWPLPEGYDAMRASTLVLRETRSPGVHPSAQCIVEYI